MSQGMTDDLFAEEEADDRLRSHRFSWWVCWRWEGPTAGGFCEVKSCVAEMETGGSIYCYTEQCRLLELRADGKWLAVIEMGEVRGKPWPKDGTRILLGELDIWPPVRLLRVARDAAARAQQESGD